MALESPQISTGIATGVAPEDHFDKYTLLAKLATGGMAEIFVARLRGAAGFRKQVVIKRILPHVAHDKDFIRMFLDEAITTARITHPNVCQVFELCEYQDTHFLVLEYLEGITVSDLLRRSHTSNKQLDMRLATGIVVQACDGLHAAHEQTDDNGESSRLVHRDVSPGNLFVTVDGIVKVLDFGIAKARWMSRKTRTGTLLGKCEYMSPEQARGGIELDRRSDIFSLGIILYELLVGKRLFRRENDYETLRAVLRHPVEPPSELRPSIPLELEHAVLRALERDRDDRFETAYDFRKAIDDALAHMGGAMPLCDIGPLIRKGFESDLTRQREAISSALGRNASEMSAVVSVLPKTAATKQARPNLMPTGSQLDDNPPSNALTEPHLAPDDSQQDRTESTTDVQTVRVLPGRPSPAAASPGDLPAEPPAPGPDDLATAVETKNLMSMSPGHRRTAPSTQQITPTLVDSKLVTPRPRAVWPLVVGSALIVGLVLAAVIIHSANRKRSAETGLQSKPVASKVVAADERTASIDTPARNQPPPAATGVDTATQVSSLAPTERGSEAIKKAKGGKLGRVTVTSSVAARLWIYTNKTRKREKQELGATPVTDLELAPGNHKFKIVADDGRERYFHIIVKAGQSVERDLDAAWR